LRLVALIAKRFRLCESINSLRSYDTESLTRLKSDVSNDDQRRR
jgi:hypothetical protein